jgi:hypothetical protein
LLQQQVDRIVTYPEIEADLQTITTGACTSVSEHVKDIILHHRRVFKGLATPEGKVIDADDRELIVLFGDASMNHPQERVVAHRHHETIGESCSRSASRRQTKVVDDRLEPLSATTVTGEDAIIELFAEDTSIAQDSVTPKSTRHDSQFCAPTTEG